MENNNKKLIPDEDILKVIEILEDMHPEAACALEHRDPFELVVAVALSAQTTDVSVNKATPALFAKYPRSQQLFVQRRTDLLSCIFFLLL